MEDCILNPVLVCGNYLSIWDAIELFGDGFKVIGSSPDMFCDWSWYKEDDSKRVMEIKRQFIRKHHTLVLAGMKEVEMDETDSEKIT